MSFRDFSATAFNELSVRIEAVRRRQWALKTIQTVRILFSTFRNYSHRLLYVFAFTSVEKSSI